MRMERQEFMESTTVHFEWAVRGIGELFENSKGETKSKVTRSARFGGGRWQILFYPNSGIVNADGQGFVSLYLACEPTAEEKDNAVNGKWVREGVYKFGFELRNMSKTILFNSKEANDHSFSYKTVNWGWAQFARRDMVYYQASSVRQADALLIICTITSSPAPPAPPPSIPRQPVPKDLLEAMGSLLDDPAYSDVEFIIPRRRGRGSRSIYAAGKVLRRVDYFDTMFRSGFAEGIRVDAPSSDTINAALHGFVDGDSAMHVGDDDEVDGEIGRFQDSDDEDDSEEDITIADDGSMELHLPSSAVDQHPIGETEDSRRESASWDIMEDERPEGVNEPNEVVDQQEYSRTPSRASHPGTPGQARLHGVPKASNASVQTYDDTAVSKLTPGPRKVRVIVKDAAYSTYRAVLHYIYTDTIVFAPLASSFHKHAQAASLSLPPAKLPRLQLFGASTPAATAPETQGNFQLGHGNKSSITAEPNAPNQPTSRKAWIAEWEKNNPGRPRPCSAKAVYRLADKLDLQELKERAFQHIIKSLTVDNVAYEVFSDFSAAFEDVRKVEVSFFLDHWADIRGSEAMRNVWQQIRLGRHPGFEEVWPLIAVNLEFKAKSSDAPNSGRDDDKA